jgi:hypothetical protein
MLVDAPATKGELDRVRLSKHDHALRDHAPGDGRRDGGASLPLRRRAAHGDPPLQIDQILQSYGNAVQRPDRMAGPDRLVGPLGCEPCIRCIDLGEGLQLRVQGPDAAQQRVHEVDGRQPPRRDLA